MKLGEYVKQVRLSKGLTQFELSEKSGVTVRTIQRIENNEVTPSIYSLNAIGKAMDMKFDSVPHDTNEGKFELRIVISNFNNLFADTKALVDRNWKLLIVLGLIVLIILLYGNLKSIFFQLTDNSTISVSTINCGTPNECDIELVKKDDQEEVVWKTIIGGSSYDKASQVLRTNNGDYLVVGSTSSFGKGNYDVLIVRVSSKGEILWQKTYGEFLNDYGLSISLAKGDLYQIEATKQICSTFNVSNDCFNQEWRFKIDDGGVVN